jgi:hypothetical protein
VERKKGGEDLEHLLNENDSLGNETITYGYCVVSSGTFAENLKNFYAKQTKTNNYQDLKNSFDTLENLRLEQLKSLGRNNFQKKHLIEFEVGISEEKAKEYLSNGIDITKGFKQLIEDLREQNILVLQSSKHFDEGYIDKNNDVKRNLHYHFLAYNYDFEKQQSILSNFEKKDFRKLQTLAQKSFQKVNLDFKRGVSKFATKKKHLEKNDFILKKQNDELKKMRSELDETNRKNKELYTLINAQKNVLKDLRLNFERDNNIYKILSLNIKNLQNEEKKVREEHRILDEQLKNLQEKTTKQIEKVEDIEEFRKSLKDDLKEYLKENTTKKDDKYYINNISDFYNSLVDTFEFASKLNIKLDKLEKLKNTNELLKQHLQKTNSENEILREQIKKIELLNVKIKDLIQTNETLEEENYHLNNFIKENKLDDEFRKFKNKTYDIQQDFER